MDRRLAPLDTDELPATEAATYTLLVGLDLEASSGRNPEMPETTASTSYLVDTDEIVILFIYLRLQYFV
jgi:hypothetical protein